MSVPGLQTVLPVEDDRELSRVVAEYLEREGYAARFLHGL